MPQTRRKFIKTMSGSTLALCCGGIGLNILMDGCTPIKHVQISVKNNKIELGKSEFNENQFVVISDDKLATSIYLNKVNDTSYNALLMLCTHKNCDVRPTGSFLTCPCHGSEFSNDGKVLKGPAKKRLTEYFVQVNGTNIIIDLNQPIQS